MTLITSGYTTLGGNQPLNHARILYDMAEGAVTASGTGGALAANDYTGQRWAMATGANTWTLDAASDFNLDTAFIAGHNLSGVTFRPQFKGDSVTNIVTRSQEFDNSAWSKVRSTVSANVLASPDGTTTADKLVENTDNGEHFADNNNIGTQPSGTYTASVFVHESSERNIRFGAIHSGDTAPVSFVTFNVAAKTFSNFSGRATLATLQEIGGGWWRVSIGFSTTDVRTIAMRVQTVDGVSTIYTGNGTSGVFVWGAQINTGGVASYVATTTASASSVWSDLLPQVWVTPQDNSPIFMMGNQSSGAAFETDGFRLVFSDAPAGRAIAIIRAGKALQMQQPFYGGHNPALWNRVTEGQQSFSETGQWLGRTQKRLAYANSYEWMHIKADWYRDNFEPFAQTLPLKPFAIAGNPARMPQDVAWAWARGDVQPQNMGLRDFVTFGMQVTGYAG